MNKLLESLTTVSKNSVDLTPHSIDRSRNIKLLEALEARNRVRVSKNTYKFTNMLDKLKKRDIIQQLENPKAYATNAPERETAERAELLRMAKITASESRDPVTNVPTAEYVKNKENFETTYMSKIARFGLLPDIEAIFEMFKDPNYKEKGFDKDYLAQGTSDAYLNSLRNKSQSEVLIKKLEDLDVARSTDMGNITTALQTADRTQLAIGANTVEQLQLLRDEQEARAVESQQNKLVQKQLQDAKTDIEDEKDRIKKKLEANGGDPKKLTVAERATLALSNKEVQNIVVQDLVRQEDAEVQALKNTVSTRTPEQAVALLSEPNVYKPGQKGVLKPYADYAKEAYRIVIRNTPAAAAMIKRYDTEFKMRSPPAPTATPQTAAQKLAMEKHNATMLRNIALAEGEKLFRKKVVARGGGGSGGV